MAGQGSSFKIGLLAILGAVAAVIAGVGLGVHGCREETRYYHTYFDESVSGLAVAAPVKYRGVAVGSVSALTIAPDSRHIDVTLGIRPTAIPKRLSLRDGDSGLRAQLNTQGITGVKLIDIDFFDPKTHPPPPLPFEPPENYLPATQSLLGALQQGVQGTVERLPEITQAVLATLASVQRLFDELQGQGLPSRLTATLETLQGVVVEVRRLVRSVGETRIPEKAAATIEHLDAAAGAITEILGRLGGDAGLVASTERATEAIATMGRGAAGATEDLDRTVRDLGDAARAVREVADQLDRDPDMLVKGRKTRSR